MTPSEVLFEAFCLQRRLHAERIATAATLEERRPDYRFRCAGRRARWVVAEIKEIVPNRDEAQAIAEFERRGVTSFSATPGKKLRGIIDAAGPQLRALAKPSDPTLIVVHEPSGLLKQHVDPYSVLTAMRGFDVVPVEVPHDPAEQTRFGAMRVGGGRRMTPTTNTSVSALGILTQVGPRAAHLDIFHNPHAQRPLRLRDVPARFVRHFRMTRDRSGWTYVR